MNWITADLHLGETRMQIMQRPFENTAAQDAVMLQNLQRLVQADDTVYFNGDLVSNAAVNPKESLAMLSKVKGRKVLVRGNHDAQFSDLDLAPYFERIIREGDGIEIELGGIMCFLTHYPTQARPDLFNLTGHIHSAWKYQLNMLNVGVDVHHYLPMAETEVPFYLKAISEFYDQDVWVADHAANLPFKGVRGKKGRYLDKIGERGPK
jgi:calcineurin-like phosphoesterase family protein